MMYWCETKLLASKSDANKTLFIVGGAGVERFAFEVGGAHLGGYGDEGAWRPGEVEAVTLRRVRSRVRRSQPSKPKLIFDEFQNAAVLVLRVRYEPLFGVR